MNLSDLRASIESEALIEKEKLEKELAEVKEKYVSIAKVNDGLRHDLKALCNRCYVTMAAKGAMCIFCKLSTYECPYKY